METKTLAIVRAVSTSLVAVLATLGVQYPHWVWVPIAAGVVSVVNLNVIPAVTSALAPTPAVQVQLTPKAQTLVSGDGSVNYQSGKDITS